MTLLKHCLTRGRLNLPLLAVAMLWMQLPAIGSAAEIEAREAQLAAEFTESVMPLVKKYCLDCHGKDKPEASLDLSAYSDLKKVTANHAHWALVLERLEADEMPPLDADRRPTPAERKLLVGWIRDLRKFEGARHAGDPGPVLARRLSNAEYDYSIRDLTGVDIRPTREFPIDPANTSGFDNSGESLSMTPALLTKYLAAARHVADHLVLGPRGLAFAPHPVVTDTDRDKYCVGRIVDFYGRQPVDLRDYFLGAWQYHHRAALGYPDSTLADVAAKNTISAKYLSTIWSELTRDEQPDHALQKIQVDWRKLLAVEPNKLDEARRQSQELRDAVVRLRKSLMPKVENLSVRGIAGGSQPLVLWKNREMAANRMRCAEPAAGEEPVPDNVPNEERKTGSADLFCRIFPDAFFITERDRVFYDSNERNSGRLLSAGFHLMSGYFRDDRPLVELVLEKPERLELDEFWWELDFVADAVRRQYRDFIFFERAEPPRFMQPSQFDFARSEDKDVTSAANIEKLSALYLAKAREHEAAPRAIIAIEEYFAEMSERIRRVETARLAAEPLHLEALVEFAGRAYRCPLSKSEADELLAFYRALRSDHGLSHEEAVRDTLASVLVSPHFSYRIDAPAEGAGIYPLPPYALASRLSYFLWSSMPDAELLRHAATGDLSDPAVLMAQTRRMLGDQRIKGLATEFGGNWLDFRRFEQHNAVDRERFAGFTNELRQAMYEEPIRFFMDLASRDGSTLDFLYARHTFVNQPLAAHYGIALPDAGGPWWRIEDADRYGRGGLLPMAVFLTANSPGLRTSPVKRGYWVVRRLLGERIPAPPPNVPELPKDEASTGEASLPQLLARHRQDKNCALCHQRFDSVGLVFEDYGPIGERRQRDLGGRPIDNQASFPDGSVGRGLDGLSDYLKQRRQREFVDNLCRKMLAYALGRELIISDEPLLEEIEAKLAADGYRFGQLIESIVTSRQFLSQRGRDYNVGG